MAAVAVVAVAVAVSAQLMFLSSHDLRLVVVAVGLGVVLGALLAATISRPLSEDLERLAYTARQVGKGDLSARTALDRPDEVGTVCRGDGRHDRLVASRPGGTETGRGCSSGFPGCGGTRPPHAADLDAGCY